MMGLRQPTAQPEAPATHPAPAPAPAAAAPAAQQGGLPDMSIQAPAAPAPAPVAAATAPAQSASKVVIGDRSFDSVEEAISYANSQESARRAPVVHQPVYSQPVATNPNDVDPGQMVFEDPKAAFRLAEDRMMAKIRQQQDQENHRTRTWGDFYSKNEDLRGYEDVVDMERNKLMGQIGALDLSVSLPILAKAARDRIFKIRQGAAQQGGQPLPSKPAMVAGGGGGQAPAPASPASAEPSDFVSQMKSIRSRKAASK